MFKIFLITVLSLASCLSLPADPPGSPPVKPQEQNFVPVINTTLKPTGDNVPTNAPVVPINSSTTGNATKEDVNGTIIKPETTPVATSDTTSNATNSENTVTTTTKATVVTTTEKKTDAPSTVKPPTTTAPSSKSDDIHVPTVQARGFDGPSFIGGIILTVGLLAVGFIGFKYYKNHTERNYNTL